MTGRNLIVLLAAASLLASSCGNGRSRGKQETKKEAQQTPSDIREPSIATNREIMKKESDDIDQYVKRQNWDNDMKVTGTGLRYMIYKSGTGRQASQGLFATVKYKVSLLDGRECYSSDKDGPKEFLIGQDNVETGLHEGIALMKVGDKAIFILPSHLAHGLMGDYNKIPPRSSVVYDIELVKLR